MEFINVKEKFTDREYIGMAKEMANKLLNVRALQSQIDAIENDIVNISTRIKFGYKIEKVRIKANHAKGAWDYIDKNGEIVKSIAFGYEELGVGLEGCKRRSNYMNGTFEYIDKHGEILKVVNMSAEDFKVRLPK